MENKANLSVVIDGKVYLLSGDNSEEYMQKIASYVDSKIRELKLVGGYGKLSAEYKNILLALNITEELFKMREEAAIFHQEHLEKEQELYRLKQVIVEKELAVDSANKLTEEYKAKVNELQRRIIELETRNGMH